MDDDVKECDLWWNDKFHLYIKFLGDCSHMIKVKHTKVKIIICIN